MFTDVLKGGCACMGLKCVCVCVHTRQFFVFFVQVSACAWQYQNTRDNEARESSFCCHLFWLPEFRGHWKITHWKKRTLEKCFLSTCLSFYNKTLLYFTETLSVQTLCLLLHKSRSTCIAGTRSFATFGAYKLGIII